MKILFGGTFDPIHNGHINLALYISQLFNQQVSYLPISGVPNYKSPPVANLEQRLAMLKLITQKYPQQITIDYNEANLTEYSPTVSTLRRLRKIYGDNEPFYFIIGGDSLVTLDIWDEWEELFKLTNFVVALRPDYPLDKMSEKLTQIVMPLITSQLCVQPAGSVLLTHFTPTSVSSTEIRRLVHTHNTIDGLVDEDINNYIRKNNLYL